MDIYSGLSGAMRTTYRCGTRTEKIRDRVDQRATKIEYGRGTGDKDRVGQGQSWTGTEQDRYRMGRDSVGQRQNRTET